MQTLFLQDDTTREHLFCNEDISLNHKQCNFNLPIYVEIMHFLFPPRLSRPKNMHNRWQIWITWWQIENWYRTASPYRREYVLELTYLFLFLHNMLSSEWDTCNVVDVVIEARTQTLKYLMSFWWNIILVSGRMLLSISLFSFFKNFK
jgi:hypothetical protein